MKHDLAVEVSEKATKVQLLKDQLKLNLDCVTIPQKTADTAQFQSPSQKKLNKRTKSHGTETEFRSLGIGPGQPLVTSPHMPLLMSSTIGKENKFRL